MSGPLFSFPPDPRIYRERRRQRLEAARAKGTHTALEWEVLRGIFGGKCVRCCTTEYRLEKDHIKPLHRGEGCDSIENIQPLCAPCNAGKGRESFDWRPHAYPRWREHFDEVMFSINERWP
jgi:5-methylcytosine-specific restriction endonuclease McrA